MSGHHQHPAKRQKIIAGRNIDTQRKVGPIKDGVVRVEELVDSRKFEINALARAIRQSKSAGAQRAFQSLPKHLRRRAASHNPSRLPQRLRHRARKEIAVDAPKPPKKKPYKVPRFVTKQEEYKWRQRDKKWLETHIWHAKRMHMQELWGYRLAETPTDKSFRPAYRASTTRAIIHDASYTAVIRVNGPMQDIKVMIDASTDPTCPSVASPRFLDGSRVGLTRIYGYCKWPKQLHCPAKFLWVRPNGGTTPSLLFFIHPSAARQVLDDFRATMLDIPVDDLRNEFTIFDIVGPFATEALHETLDLAGELDRPAGKTWQGLQGLRSTKSLGSGVVLSLEVKDPRLTYPPKPVHGKKQANASLEDALKAWTKPTDLVASHLFDDEGRHEVNEAQISQADINRRKEKNAIPGSRLPILESDPIIPIVLVQLDSTMVSTISPISDCLSGWTVIAPSKWSLPFWHHLVYTGIMVGGQREVRNQHFESGLPVFPHDYGATCRAGQDIDEARGAEEKEHWERKPPSKRVNYDKLDSTWPFQAPWRKLVAQHHLATTVIDTTNVEPWLIQGTKSIQAYLALAGEEESNIQSKFSAFLKIIQAKRWKKSAFQDANLDHAVVMVRLRMIGRGAPMRLAMICPIEDENEYNETKRLTDRTMRPSKRKVSDIQSNMDSDVQHTDSDQDEGEDVEINGNTEISSSRHIIGFVTSGRYALSTGCGQGIGTCSAMKLLNAIRATKQWTGNAKHSPIFVQIRNPVSRHYHPAQVDVLT